MKEDAPVPTQSGPSNNGITIRAFFEQHPPGSSISIVDAVVADMRLHDSFAVVCPNILLHCPSEPCNGPRFHVSANRWNVRSSSTHTDFIAYKCRNCDEHVKTDAVCASFGEDPEQDALKQKFGEIPQFGAPTPSRVAKLLGSERDYYFKGRRAEEQSMGIAAFAYYRRVVENRKTTIFDEIIRVSEMLDADAALIAELQRAKGKGQFSRAVGSIKHALPQALLINGHNPLTLQSWPQ